jgi:cell division protease FtsH
VPSSIPPVEIPEEIRKRAQNGTRPEQSRPDQILTPPSGSGDVHGGGHAPEPPAPPAPPTAGI